MTLKSLISVALAAQLMLTLPVLAQEQSHSGHGIATAADTAAAPAAEIKAGDLLLSGAFARATPPGAPVGGGFLSIANDGAADDLLLGGSATFADTVEVHEMKMEGEVMQMRALPEGLDIPAGEITELKPGGLHLMFMGLKQPLKQGDTVEVTLDFQRAGKVVLPLAVLSPGAKAAATGHDGH